IIEDHIAPKHFSISICRHLYTLYMENRKEGKGNDLLTLANNLESVEEQLLFSEIMQKKVNTEKAKEGVIETVQKILDRYWLEEREKVRITIQKGGLPEEEILKLAKQFDALKRSSPILNLKKE
ncbi:MAG: DNA primase, partial [Simkania negevensis]|nr:DNA primase [Simkania negevensis]